MQFQADLLQTTVIRPKVYETTALGAAYLAGLGVGFWENTDQLQHQWQADAHFHPLMQSNEANNLIKGWRRAVKASIAWADENE